MCPVCYAVGDNADSECDANIENKPCLDKKPVCAFIVSTQVTDFKYRGRACLSRELYNKFKDVCSRDKECATAMCETSGCKAEFPSSGILVDFSMLKNIIIRENITAAFLKNIYLFLILPLLGKCHIKGNAPPPPS